MEQWCVLHSVIILLFISLSLLVVGQRLTVIVLQSDSVSKHLAQTSVVKVSDVFNVSQFRHPKHHSAHGH